MKKVFKILSLFFIIINLLFITKVHAATDDIVIDSVSIKETFGSVIVEEPVFDDNNLTSNITFNEEDDYVDFKLTLKNVSEEKYKITSIEDNNSNENISVEYEYSENYIESGDSKHVTIRLKYKNQLMDIEKISINDLTIHINLEKESGKRADIVINPFTHDALLHYLGILVLTIIGLLLIIINKIKKKKPGFGIIAILIAVILIPFAAIANERYTVDFKYTNIDVIGKVQKPATTAILIDGESFNSKLNNDVTIFREATEEEFNAIENSLNNNNIVSIEDSPEIAYLWFDGEKALYYSRADIIYMNEDSSKMFENSKFTSIDLSGLNSSNVTNMASMFNDCTELLEVNLSSFNTKNVTDMNYMFSNCNKLLELDLLKFNTEKVTNMEEMFDRCRSLTVLDLSSFDTRSLTNASGMFSECRLLVTIYVSNKFVDRSIIDEYDEESNELGQNMFGWDDNLVGEMGTTWHDEPINDGAFARVDRGPYKRGFFTLKGTLDIAIFVEGPAFNEKLLGLTTSGKSFRQATEEEYNNVKDNLTEDDIVSLSKMTPIYMWETNDNILYYSEAETIYFHPNSSYMFANSELVNIDVSKIDGFIAKDMSYMFYQNEYLTNINFGEYIEETSNSGTAMNSNNRVSADILSTVSDNKLIILIPIFVIIICAGIYVIFKTTKINKNGITIGAAIITFLIASLTITLGSFGLNKLLAYVGTPDGRIDTTPGHFSTEKVNNMTSMFEGCSSLRELDLTVFETTSEIFNVDVFSEEAESMYIGEAEGSTDITNMFKDCTKLETIYVSSKWNNELTWGSGYTSGLFGDKVFTNCYNLVGEKGTAYTDPYFDHYNYETSYARIDGGTYESAGYFTRKGYEKSSPTEATFASRTSSFSNDFDTNGKSFRRATTQEYEEVLSNLDEYSIVSAEDSPVIYMWVYPETNEVLYYSKAKTIYLPEDASNLFSSTYLQSIDLTGIDSSKTKNMSYMFSYNSELIKLDLSSFDTSNVTDMSGMFYNCDNLEKIYVSNLWNTSKVTESSDMFYDAYNLYGEKGTTYDENNVDVSYAHIDGGSSNPGYLTTVNYVDDSTMMIRGEDFKYRLSEISSDGKHFRPATENEYNSAKNSLSRDNVVSVSSIDSAAVYIWQSGDDVLYYSKANKIYLNKDSTYMFSNTTFESIDLSGFDAIQVKNMSYMFSDSASLTSIDLSMLDTGNVTNMSDMFFGCTSLTNIYFGELSENTDITNNLSASISSISNSKTPVIIIILVPILLLIVGIGIYIAIKTNSFKKIEMTVGTLIIIITVVLLAIFLGTFGLNKLMASVNQGNESNNQDTFYFSTKNVTDMSGMFSDCTSLTELDLSIFDTSSLEYLDYMFNNCFNLVTIYASEKWDIGLILTDDTSNGGIGYYSERISDAYYVFDSCYSLVGDLGTSYGYSGYAYARIDGGPGDPGYFSLKNRVIDNSSAKLLTGPGFQDIISSLSSFGSNGDARNFRPATLEEYNSAKSSLTDANVVSVGMPKVYVWELSEDAMVYYSEAETIYMNLDSRGMFEGRNFEKIDLSGFDSSKVKLMNRMFHDCHNLKEVDLSSFNTGNVTNLSNMFDGCQELTTVYVSNLWNVSNATGDAMFYDSINLVGGAATIYDENNVDVSYAHIDGGSSNPGYFTNIADKQ